MLMKDYQDVRTDKTSLKDFYDILRNLACMVHAMGGTEEY